MKPLDLTRKATGSYLYCTSLLRQMRDECNTNPPPPPCAFTRIFCESCTNRRPAPIGRRIKGFGWVPLKQYKGWILMKRMKTQIILQKNTCGLSIFFTMVTQFYFSEIPIWTHKWEFGLNRHCDTNVLKAIIKNALLLILFTL